LTEQLQTMFGRLKRRHTELLGIGLGARRRRGRLQPELTVKLQVRRKVGDARGVRLFPKTVRLTTVALGQVVAVDVPTDVETPRRMRPTHFGVGAMTASAWALWDEQGQQTLGVVSAAHGLKDDRVSVRLRDGSEVSGTVVVRSSLAAHGVDVGLVRLQRIDSSLMADAGPASPPLATADELLDVLSSSPTDLIGMAAESWSSSGVTRVRGVAFYPVWHWDGVEGELRNVVECRATKLGAFAPGTSGSSWIAVGAHGERKAIALQSHGFPPLFHVAAGTHFQSAIEWLKAQKGLATLRIAWRAGEL
jgi:hypothetical protein